MNFNSQIRFARAYQNKIYVVGIRCYWKHILEDQYFAYRIPYPKEQPSLPKILSHEELSKLFNSCNNLKHRVLYRLLHSSGLRRSELRNLKTVTLKSKMVNNRVGIIKGRGVTVYKSITSCQHFLFYKL